MQQQIGWRIIWWVLGVSLAVGIVVGLVACSPNGTGSGRPQDTVNGTAVASPTCPAGQSGQPCSSSPTPKGTQSEGTLNGTVVAGPTCPVESVDNPCPPRPVPDRLVLIETTAGTVAARATTDQQGRFVVTLSPGTYTLLVPPGASQFPIQRVTQKVTIGAGQTTQVTIELDTGIR